MTVSKLEHRAAIVICAYFVVFLAVVLPLMIYAFARAIFG